MIKFIVCTIKAIQVLSLEIRFFIDDPSTIQYQMAAGFLLKAKTLKLSILISKCDTVTSCIYFVNALSIAL